MLFYLFSFLLIAAIIIFLFTFKSSDSTIKFVSRIVGWSSVILITMILLTGFTSVQTGHIGVITSFGSVQERYLEEGLNWVLPWKKNNQMSVQKVEIKEVMEIPSKEGMNIHLELSLIFKLEKFKASMVYQTIGVDYINKIIIPKFRSVVRDVSARYEAKDFFSEARIELNTLIFKEIKEQVESIGVTIDSAPMRDVRLPAALQAAVVNKLKFEQESQQMQFVLSKEKQEAERKRVEAQGISDFQRIVSQGISPQLLEWKGIEATLELAKSSNAKVVVVGSGKNGLPIILGNQ